MLVLSEGQVRKCLTMTDCIAANRLALSSLRVKKVSFTRRAVVPTRLALPFGSNPQDNSLFKPAVFYGEKEVLMGVKIVSVRSENSNKGLPIAPSTLNMINYETGEVFAIVASTYLTAARTAAGCAIATEYAMKQNGVISFENLVVLGAGLQAECHIMALAEVFERKIKNVTIVNRSKPRANKLRDLLQLNPKVQHIDFKVVTFDEKESFKKAIKSANIICTAINSTSPIFDWSWVTQSCHINGVGSYNPNMEEIDCDFIKDRCIVVADTAEALNVGDLCKISDQEPNFRGLLGDIIAEDSNFVKTYSSQCTVFKSTGTAVQDILTAASVIQHAKQEGIGTNVDMN